MTRSVSNLNSHTYDSFISLREEAGLTTISRHYLIHYQMCMYYVTYFNQNYLSRIPD